MGASHISYQLYDRKVGSEMSLFKIGDLVSLKMLNISARVWGDYDFGGSDSDSIGGIMRGRKWAPVKVTGVRPSDAYGFLYTLEDLERYDFAEDELVLARAYA